MNVLDAAQRIGLEYPGGIEALAARMNKNPTVFRSKLNPNNSTHQLYLEEAMAMQALTGRHDIAIAMDDELGRSSVLCEALDSDVSLVSSIMKTMAEFGDWMRKAEAAMEDGELTPNELKELEKEYTEMIAEASRMHGKMKAMAGQGGRHG